MKLFIKPAHCLSHIRVIVWFLATLLLSKLSAYTFWEAWNDEWWLMCVGPCHKYRRPRKNSRLLASALSSSDGGGHLENELATERYLSIAHSLSSLSHPFLFFKQLKIISTFKSNVSHIQRTQKSSWPVRKSWKSGVRKASSRAGWLHVNHWTEWSSSVHGASVACLTNWVPGRKSLPGLSFGPLSTSVLPVCMWWYTEWW